jgi:hypothetical protein
LVFFCGLSHLRHDSFSEGRNSLNLAMAKVNKGDEIIWALATSLSTLRERMLHPTEYEKAMNYFLEELAGTMPS